MTARNMIAITEENSCKTGAVHKWQRHRLYQIILRPTPFRLILPKLNVGRKSMKIFGDSTDSASSCFGPGVDSVSSSFGDSVDSVSSSNKNTERGNIGSWAINGICRRVSLLGGGLLWICTSSNFKIRNANMMPSSFSRGQSELHLPKSMDEEISSLRKPAPSTTRSFDWFKFKVRFLPPFRGYCQPKLGVAYIQDKIARTHEDVFNYDPEIDKAVDKFVSDLVISRSIKRGEDISLVKMWLDPEKHSPRGKEIWHRDCEEALTFARKSVSTVVSDVKNDLDNSGVLEFRDSVSPLEYSKFAKECQSYTSKASVRKDVKQKLDQKLKAFLDADRLPSTSDASQSSENSKAVTGWPAAGFSDHELS
ncbi:hypothetical protein [Roseibium aggregatum]|nr:hypothetical protein [Roseibium aggregatum]